MLEQNMEGLIGKENTSDEFESPKKGSSDSLRRLRNMDRQKTLVLPLGEDDEFVPAKRRISGSRIFFAICRIFGCFHFDDKGRCTLSNLAYSLIFNSLLAASYVYVFSHLKKDTVGSERSQVLEDSIGLAAAGGNAVFSAVSAIVLFLYKNRFPQVMKNVDFKLHAGNKFAVGLLLSIYATMASPIVAVGIIAIPFNLVIFQHCLYLSQYVILTNRWNRYLMTMTKYVTRFDEKMMEGHAKVIRAQRSLNDIYGLPILFNVVLSFTTAIHSLFNLYVSLKTGNLDLTIIPSVLFSGVLIFWVAAAADFTTKLANNFNTELFKVMNRNTKLRNNTSLRLYLLKKYTLDFTACGFFTVGYPFITSLIAAAVTYLVVLIQFTE